MTLVESLKALRQEQAEILGRKEFSVILTVNQLIVIKLAILEVQEVHKVSGEPIEPECAEHLSASLATIQYALDESE